MNLSNKAINEFQNKIFGWWSKNKRDLPWRNTHDPYHILISEVMLQQTQVERVLPKYEEFIRKYPSVFSLAASSTSSVLRIWKGLGYNRRALYLKKASEIIVDSYNGVFPKNEKELIKLPGLGTYTARAILVFAFKQDVACVDTNIRQIILHHFSPHNHLDEKTVQHVADQLLPKGKAWEWHQALMDYGSLVLLKNKKRIKNSSTNQSRIPFAKSNRFYRGRIIDLLRVRSYDKKRLLVHLEEQYKKSYKELAMILASLESEGLVAVNKEKISLPD